MAPTTSANAASRRLEEAIIQDTIRGDPSMHAELEKVRREGGEAGRSGWGMC